jgi:hypothetical protein
VSSEPEPIEESDQDGYRVWWEPVPLSASDAAGIEAVSAPVSGSSDNQTRCFTRQGSRGLDMERPPHGGGAP